MYKNLINTCLVLVILLLVHSCTILQKFKTDETQVDSRTRDFNFNRYFLEGARQKTLGNFDEALRNYLLATRVDSTEPAVYYEIAGILNMAGDYSAALNYAEQAVKLDKYNNEYYKILLAEVYQRNNLLSKAVDVYEDLIKINPDEIVYYFSVSELYFSIGNERRAIRTLNNAEKHFGVLDFISLEKERLYRLMGENSKAVGEMEKLSKTYPDNVNYKILLAESYINNSMYDKALKTFEQVEFMKTENGLIYFSVADFYRITEEYDKMFSFLQKGFAAQDVDMDIKIKMMINLLSFVDDNQYLFKNTSKLMDILLVTYPEDIKVRTLYSDFLVYEGKYDLAQKEFDFILKHEKSRFILWEQALFIDNQLSDWEAMYHRSKEAVEYFPNQSVLFLFYAISSYQTENFQDVIKAGKRAISIIISDDDMLVQILTFKGEAYRKLDKHKESDEIFDLVLSMDPEYTMVLNNYSYYLALREDNLDKAIEMSTKLMTLDTTNAAYLDTHAWVLYKHGKYEDALEYIDKAIQKNSESAIHFEHKGDILYKLSKKEEALLFWKKALEIGEGSDFLEKKVIEKTLIE